MPRFHYQTVAENAFSGPEDTGKVDKWEPKVHDGQMWIKRGLAAAILAGSFFWPGGEAMAWMTVDKWQPQTVDYHYQKPVLPPSIQSGSFFWHISDEPEAIYPDKYQKQESPDYNYRKPYLSQAIQAGSSFTPIYSEGWWSIYYPYPDRWGPSTVYEFNRKKSLPPAVQSGSFFFVRYFPVIETVTPDKWLAAYPVQVQRKPPLRQSQDQTFVPWYGAETITMDKWKPILPDLAVKGKAISGAILAGAQFHHLDPTLADHILISEWMPAFPDILIPKPHLLAAILAGSHFWFPFDLNPPWVDKWIGEYPARITRVARLSESCQQALMFQWIPAPEDYSLDKWSPSYPDYLFRKHRPSMPELAWAPITITPELTVEFVGIFPDQILQNPRVIAAIEAGYLFYQEKPPYPGGTLYVWRRVS